MYDLLLNEDESMIADTVREFLEDKLPVERLRPNARTLDTKAVWNEMSDLGWFGVGLPEEGGGSGMGLVEEMLIQRECGRHLTSPCVLATVLAAHVCWNSGDGDVARGFASGQATAAIAIDAAPGTGGNERSAFLLDWNGLDSVIYWDSSGMVLCGAAGVHDPKPAESLDDSITLHAARLDLSYATHRVEADSMPLPARADVLLSSALVGLAGHALDLTVAYTKVREQFGKPIGTFQAVKHRCADMAVRHRLAWYQTCMAALKLQSGADDAPLQVASAKLLAAEAALENGRAAIQLHGGIGFQAECDAHWFLKRAYIYDQAGGARPEQAERIIAEPASL